jgi:S-(hydroxymethyl)glutathione dehydrogenase / alcohol dehydrogenase
MRAAVCEAFGLPLVVETVGLDGPGAGEISVEVAACAICHSDIFYADGAWGGQLPAVYGHAAAGVVRRLGDEVKGFAVGDHVVVTLIRACGTCPSCSHGHPVTCETRFAREALSPLRRANGERLTQGLKTAAFAERVVVDASQAVVVPQTLSLESASLLACGVITGFGAAINTAQVQPGASVAVIGIGGVGLNVVQGAAYAGAGKIIAIDVVPAKLDVAPQFGATHALDATARNLRDQLRRLTGGRGADYVFVTVGAKAAFQQSFELVARSGTIVLVGMPADGVKMEIEAGLLASDNLRLLGSKMGDARIQVDIPMLVDLYQQGRLKLDELVSGRYPLERINEAMASTRGGAAIRNVITFA